MLRLIASAFVAAALASAASAQEAHLRGVSAFAEKTTYSRRSSTSSSASTTTGKGVIQINYIGGPKAMPPFEVGNALKSGVIDIANATGAFYTNVMPEADAWKLTAAADGGAAQERRLRRHGQALCAEDERDLPRARWSTTIRSTSI